MTTAAEVTALANAVSSLSDQVLAIETDEDLRAELDGVNGQLDALRGQAAIALRVIADTTYTQQQKLDLILATLENQP